MCLYPRLITNPKYKKTKKNGGVIPPLKDKRVNLVPIGCQNCIECRKQKSREWNTRLLEDIKQNTNGRFVTLTFSNEKWMQNINEITKHYTKHNREIPTAYNLDNTVATWATRHFLERWRKHNKKSVRHWLITELGHNGTENLHLHGIIWTDTPEQIEKHWQNGYVWAGYKKNGKLQNYVNERTVTYITKYVTKIDFQHKLYRPVILTSDGIGGNYTKNPKGDWVKNKYNGTQTNELYRNRQGYKYAMPNYWRNKIYTEQEREELWLQKLNKQERWVLGQRIDISKNEIQYERALKEAQKFNKELGYANEISWEEAEYQRQRRLMKQQERITKANKKL